MSKCVCRPGPRWGSLQFSAHPVAGFGGKRSGKGLGWIARGGEWNLGGVCFISFWGIDAPFDLELLSPVSGIGAGTGGAGGALLPHKIIGGASGTSCFTVTFGVSAAPPIQEETENIPVL